MMMMAIMTNMMDLFVEVAAHVGDQVVSWRSEFHETTSPAKEKEEEKEREEDEDEEM